ncbi:MAG: adenine phosphoribosyltransferase, partial [Proteobacteria bacterium]|nr:adenine phosphoribosyltransferase [Pseudomonadota bacterium]
ATGGTMAAAARLLRDSGAEVIGAACLIELAFLNGRDKLDIPMTSLVSYDN